MPAVYPELRIAADAIEDVMQDEPVPCDNDLLTVNFLDDGVRLRILDWEYAGMGNRFFDLATFASHHDLGPDEMTALLAAYFGESTAAGAAVRLMRLMAAFWEGMWGVIQATCSEMEFDFMGYAEEQLAKVRTSLAEPGFATWLEEARAA